jgi:hypothetical protein
VNVWKGTQGTIISDLYFFSGENYGYILGGEANNTGQPNSDKIQYFAFSSDSSVTLATNTLASQRGDGNGSVKSDIAIYCLGGVSTIQQNSIEKALVSSGPELVSNTLGATLSDASSYTKTVSSPTKGYYFGKASLQTRQAVIFASDTNASVGGTDFVYPHDNGAGITGPENGYAIASYSFKRKNEKWTYASDTALLSIADLVSDWESYGGQNSTSTMDYGFLLGNSSPSLNEISRISFVNDTWQMQYSSLTATGLHGIGAGISGKDNGYYGHRDVNSSYQTLDRFSYTSATAATRSAVSLPAFSHLSAGSQS